MRLFCCPEFIPAILLLGAEYQEWKSRYSGMRRAPKQTLIRIIPLNYSYSGLIPNERALKLFVNLLYFRVREWSYLKGYMEQRKLEVRKCSLAQSPTNYTERTA